MFADSVRASFNNLSAMTFAVIMAVFFAVVATNSLSTPFGAQQIEAPLLWVVAANLLLSWLVAQLTVRDRGSLELTRTEAEKSNAAYVFASAAGALTTSASQLVEVLDVGKITSTNSLTVVLNAIYANDPTLIYPAYGIFLGGLVILSLLIVVRGARILASSESVTESVQERLGSFSGSLLAVSVMTGTTWQQLPGDTSQVARIWALVIFGLILLFSIWMYGFFAFRFMKAMVSLTMNGLVSGGRTVSDPSFWSMLWRVVLHVLRGAGLALAFALTIYACLVALAWVAVVTASIPEELVKRSLSLVFGALLLALRATFWIVLAAACSIPALRVWAALRESIRLSVVLAVMLRSECWPKIMRFASQLARRIFDFFRRLLDTRNQPKLSGVRALFSVASAVVLRACTRSIRMLGDFFDWTMTRFKFGATLLMYAALLAASSHFVPFPNTLPPTVSPPAANPAELEKSDPQPVELVEPEPTLRLLSVTPIPFCELKRDNLEWSFGIIDRFDIALNDCTLSRSAQSTFDAIVFIGFSSLGNSRATESSRAKDRGQRLAEWAARQLKPETEVYVINLGMAENRSAPQRLDWIGRSGASKRPAYMLGLQAYPDGVDFTVGDVSERLSSYLSRVDLKRNFSNCELFLFDRRPDVETPLINLPSFDCER